MRVCGDLACVEAALKGEKVDEWSYLEDLALSKPTDSSEFQWLLKSKGMEQIQKRRKFLLTATAPDEEEPDALTKMKTPAQQQQMKEEDAGLIEQDMACESVAYI